MSATSPIPRIVPRPVASASPKSAPAVLLRPKLIDGGQSEPPQGANVAAPIEPISQYIDLEIEARRCATIEALRYAIVNSTRKLAHFEQAFIAEPALQGGWTITAASSVVSVDRNADAVQALLAWIETSGTGASREPKLANLSSAVRTPASHVTAEAVAFPYAFWLPIKARDGRILAALIALKAENWRPQHSTLLLPLADAYGHAWEALAPKTQMTAQRIRSSLTKSRVAIGAALIALVAAFVPVPLSALAPAEVVAANPMLVTAPIDGVIGEIFVAPGTWVEAGAPLVRFIDVKLRNDLEVARRSKVVAEARHFKVLQSAVATQKDMQEIGTTKAELDVAVAELQFAEDMLARSVIRAERSGLLIYTSKSDWLGKPVTIGERLMEVGDPAYTEIRIDLPVSDAVAIQKGGDVALFLDGSPLSAIEGKIERTSYRPTLTADQQMAFRIYARIADGLPKRIGLRGVARVHNESVSLWFYLFRRPIASVRQRVGL
jgi:HlyD family secretion protein